MIVMEVAVVTVIADATKATADADPLMIKQNQNVDVMGTVNAARTRTADARKIQCSL